MNSQPLTRQGRRGRVANAFDLPPTRHLTDCQEKSSSVFASLCPLLHNSFQVAHRQDNYREVLAWVALIYLLCLQPPASCAPSLGLFLFFDQLSLRCAEYPTHLVVVARSPQDARHPG